MERALLKRNIYTTAFAAGNREGGGLGGSIALIKANKLRQAKQGDAGSRFRAYEWETETAELLSRIRVDIVSLVSYNNYQTVKLCNRRFCSGSFTHRIKYLTLPVEIMVVSN